MNVDAVMMNDKVFRKLLAYPTALRILDYFAGMPGKELYGRLLGTETKTSVGASNQAARFLCEAGFLKRARKGKEYYYSAENNALLRSFKIFSSICRLSPILALLEPVSESIYLYGSSAQGENHEKSDVDLLLIVRDRKTSESKIKKAKLPEKISVMVKTVDEILFMKRSDPALYENAMLKGIRLK